MGPIIESLTADSLSMFADQIWTLMEPVVRVAPPTRLSLRRSWWGTLDLCAVRDVRWRIIIRLGAEASLPPPLREYLHSLPHAEDSITPQIEAAHKSWRESEREINRLLQIQRKELREAFQQNIGKSIIAIAADDRPGA